MERFLTERRCTRCAHRAPMVVEAETTGLEPAKKEEYLAILVSMAACPACGEDGGRAHYLRIAKLVHRLKLYGPALLMYGLAWLMGDRSSPLIGFEPGHFYENSVLTIGIVVIISLLLWDRSRKTAFDPNPLGLRASARFVTPEVAEEVRRAELA